MQSSSQIVTTNKPTRSFSQAGCPSCCPTNSIKALKGKYHIPWTCLPQAHLGVFQLLSLTTNSSWCYLGEGCHASHQPSDASTPNTIVTVKYFLKAYLKLYIVQKANCLVMNNTSSYQQCCMMHNHGFLLHIRLSLR